MEILKGERFDMKRRVDWIDIAKGLCILLVVFGHELTWDDGLRYAIYAFHIPMFFILSGMTVFLSGELENKFEIFLKRNINGLFRPYIIVSCIYTGFDIIRGGIT